MKKIFKDYYLTIKEKFDLKRKLLLFEGLLLTIAAIICLIFNQEPKTLTILYLFPISIIIIAIAKLVYADNYKELDDKRWIFIVVTGLVYLLFAFYLIINPLNNGNDFLIAFSSFMIFNNLIKLIIFDEKSLLHYISIGFLVLLSILVIIFNSYILENLYLYLIILYLVYGIIKIAVFFIINKLHNKK